MAFEGHVTGEHLWSKFYLELLGFKVHALMRLDERNTMALELLL